MNIVIDIRPLMGGKLSGVEIYTWNLLDHLFTIDKKNNYILYANAFTDQSQYLPHYTHKNVRTLQTRIPNKCLNLSLFLFKRPKIDKLIQRHLKEKFLIDLYFQPDLRPSALSKGIKKISVIHDLSFFHFPQFFSIKSKLWYKLLRPKKELEESEKIIAVSEFTKSDVIKNFRIPGEKIKVILEGIHENFGANISDKEKNRVRKKYNLPENFLLFLSTLEPRKNTQNLIKAFKKYISIHKTNLKLVMAGTKQEAIFSKLHLENSPDIVFTGFIEEQDKATVYRLAKAFIYPSLFEGFGLPLLEAMKSQTPIITSRAASMPEIVQEAAILVNPHDTEEMAKAIHSIQQPETMVMLKEKMKKRIGDFSWKKCAEETLQLFTEVFNN